MRIGIIAEGRTDQAVIKNILRGIGFDSSDVQNIRPTLQRDETDKNSPTIGTWQGVKNACVNREDFERFFYISDNKYIIIQLDTAECEQADFGIKRPKKEENSDYSTELRAILVEKINNWLDDNYENKLLYAISIEEMEAWILTIFTTTNTTFSIDPKKKLFAPNGELRKRNIDNKGCRDDAEFYDKITTGFRKKKLLASFQQHNESLREFINSIDSVFQAYKSKIG
jgi:hypothetical protein